jgi:hypothetical protein
MPTRILALLVSFTIFALPVGSQPIERRSGAPTATPPQFPRMDEQNRLIRQQVQLLHQFPIDLSWGLR